MTAAKGYRWIELIAAWNVEGANRGGRSWRRIIVFTGEETVAGTLLNELSASPAFVNLLQQVYEQGSGHPAPIQSLYQVLRCLKGKSGLTHSLRFHYDSYVVTALLPVIIPSPGSAGHLVMAPNRRPVRASYMFNQKKMTLNTRSTSSKLWAGSLCHRSRSAVRASLWRTHKIHGLPTQRTGRTLRQSKKTRGYTLLESP
jgi:hypothetical protein